MQVLDRTGVGTLWSICKTKFALKDHSHNYLPLSGGTLTGDLLFSNSGTTFRQIRGTCGDNDFWRIGGGATGNNAGYMEIATADDGTEPIYVRQYSGTFSTITRTATLLDGSGNTSFPGTVAAAKFKGALEGNASTASNASTVNGHTVNANVPSNAKFTDTNTWRPIQDNLTSTSTSESLSANQGRILKGLVDGKANSSHTHSWSQISGAPATATRWPSWGEVTSKPGSFTPSSHTHDWSQVTGKPDLKAWSEIKSYIDSKKSVAVVGNGGTVKLIVPPKMFTETIQETYYNASSQTGAVGNTIYPEKRYNCTYMIMSKYDSNVMLHRFTGMFDYVLITGSMSGTVQEEILKKFGLKQDWYEIVDTYDNTYFFIKMKDVFIYEYKGFIQNPLNQDAKNYFNVYYTTYYRYTDKGIQECDSMGNLLT